MFSKSKYLNWLVVFICVLSYAYLPMTYATSKQGIARSLQMEEQETGVVSLHFSSPKDKALRGIASILEHSRELQSVVEGINKKFIFPVNIKIEFSENEGPLYDLETKTIFMSYEFISFLSGLYLENYPDAATQEKVKFLEDTTIFFIYHELGHALIDIYKLPIVSNEETAADNLAVIMALDYMDDGYNIAMNSADLFDMFEQTNEKYDDDELWDEHALDSQRFYNIICLTYGRYPQEVMTELKELENKTLLKFVKEKGDYCEQTYQQQHRAWLHLLDIHFTSH